MLLGRGKHKNQKYWNIIFSRRIILEITFLNEYLNLFYIYTYETSRYLYTTYHPDSYF